MRHYTVTLAVQFFSIPSLMVHNTNIDNNTPPSRPDLPSAGTNENLSQSQHCYITPMWKQNHFYSTKQLHTVWRKTKLASGLKTPPVDLGMSWMKEQAGEEVAAQRRLSYVCNVLHS